jgi:MFS transporter, OFA family, oxalate/formate antiporter
MSTRQISVRARPGAALAAATIMSLPLGSLYAFSVLLVPLEQLLQASRSELASVFGISAVFFTIGANLAPRLFGRIRAPILLALTGAISSAGAALAAVAPSLIWLILGYGMLFATGGGMAYVVVQQCVNAAPLARPGLVNGYLVSLFPLGAMLAAPAFGLGLDWVGVRLTLAGLAAVIGTAALVATLLVAHQGVVLAKTGRPTPSAAGSQDRLQATFWKLFTIFFLAASAGLMVLSQVAGMVAAFGAGKSASLLATTGITGAIAAARLMGGWLIDRLPVPYVASSAQGIALLGAIALTVMPSPEVAILTLGLIGVGYGLISGVTAAAVASYWPKVEFGRIVSRIYIAWCLAAISLPVLAGRLYDLTGGYETAVMVAGGANLLAALVALTLPAQKRAR